GDAVDGHAEVAGGGAGPRRGLQAVGQGGGDDSACGAGRGPPLAPHPGVAEHCSRPGHGSRHRTLARRRDGARRRHSQRAHDDRGADDGAEPPLPTPTDTHYPETVAPGAPLISPQVSWTPPTATDAESPGWRVVDATHRPPTK